MESDEGAVSPELGKAKLSQLLQELSTNQTRGVQLLQALKGEMAVVTRQNEKLKQVNEQLKVDATNNAYLVMDFKDKCIRYKQENKALKAQLQDLQNKCLRGNDYSGLVSGGSALPDVGQQQLEEDVQEISIIGEHPKERRPSKLSRPRGQRRVRYQELPRASSTSPPFPSRTSSPDAAGSSDGRASGSALSRDGRDIVPDGEKGDHSAVTREARGDMPAKDTGDHSLVEGNGRLLSRQGPAEQRWSGIRRETSDVFVPETEMVRDDSEDVDDNDYCDEASDSHQLVDQSRQHQRNVSKNSKVISIPETMPPDETCIFSPIQTDVGTRGQQTLKNRSNGDWDFSDNLAPLEQSTPMLAGPSDISRRVMKANRNCASPHLHGSGESNKKGIPPSESQLSVDFASNEMSPIFDGGEGRLALSRTTSSNKTKASDAIVETADNLRTRKSSSLTPAPCKEMVPPASKHIISSRSRASCIPKTPEPFEESNKVMASISVNDESAESETSFLLLQHPSTYPSTERRRQDPSKSRGDGISSQDRKRKSGIYDESGQKRGLSDDEGMSANKRKRMVYLETAEKEESRHEQISGFIANKKGPTHEGRKSVPDQPAKESVTAVPGVSDSKTTAKKSKQMVQTTLTKDSFKPVVSKEGQRQREYNGGGPVSKDSQENPYLQQALQESMALARLEEQRKPCGESTDVFKVPDIPRGLQRGARGEGYQLDDSCEILDGNLNGSLDPGLHLSLLDGDGTEAEGAFTHKSNKNGGTCAGGSKRNRSNDARNPSYQGDGDPGPSFVDDSFADMFADDDDGEAVGDEVQEDETLGREDQVETTIDEPGMETECKDEIESCTSHQEAEREPSSLAKQFDSVPKKGEAPAYKFKDVVRKRDDRQKLKGFDCKECAGFYGAIGLTDEQIALRTKNCSRHRGHYSPPSTPEHYWSIDFPDTPTCIQRGYMKEAVTVADEAPRRKRKMGFRHNFTRNKDHPPS